jgi:hypothetical protein
MFPNLVIGLMTSILPSVISAVAPRKEVPGAGITVTNTATTTNLASLVVSAVMMALGAAGLGADAFHTVAAVAGALGVVLTTINHLHLTSGSNANTIALVADLLAQVAAYKADSTASAPVIAGVTSDLSASTATLEATIAQASKPDVTYTVAPSELAAPSTVSVAS